MNRRSFGFTLIELMVTLAVLTIGLAIAVPSFMEMIQKNRISGAADALVADMQLARQEGIKRNAAITVVFQGAGTTNWCYGLDDNATACDCTQASGVGTGNCEVGAGANAFAKVVQGSNFRDVALVAGANNITFESVRGTANNGAGGAAAVSLSNYTARIQVGGLGSIAPCSAGNAKLIYTEC